MEDQKLSIRIKIAEREYPMQVSTEAESILRNAGKKLNEKIQFYREEFGIEDRQDLLSMVAFDCMVELLTARSEKENMNDLVSNKVSQWNELVSSALKID